MQSQRRVTVGCDATLRRLAATFGLPAALVGGMFAPAVVRADPALEEIVVTAQKNFSVKGGPTALLFALQY
jgi:hypothetical protein